MNKLVALLSHSKNVRGDFTFTSIIEAQKAREAAEASNEPTPRRTPLIESKSDFGGKLTPVTPSSPGSDTSVEERRPSAIDSMPVEVTSSEHLGVPDGLGTELSSVTP